VITSIHDWQRVLQQSDPLIGIPLIVMGIAMLAFGWRLWRVCATVTFAALGYAIGVAAAQDDAQRMLFAVGGSLGFALAGMLPLRWAVALMGGVTGTGIVLKLAFGLGMRGAAGLVAGGLALLGLTALSAIYRRYVVILLSSFEGALLMLSGVAAILMSSTSMCAVVREMAGESPIVVPFLLLVPTAIGFFYQASEARRAGAEL
jgi:hypothetical protein